MANNYLRLSAAEEIHNHRTDEVGANMAAFALGSLASMATRNPTIQVPGLVPILGFNLSIHWNYVLALCLCIVAAHFIIFATAIYNSRLVVIKDESNISIARLLRPLVEHLGDGGTILDGKELCGVIEGRVGSRVVYGVREGKGEGRVLDVGEGIVPREWLRSRRHPDGRYL